MFTMLMRKQDSPNIPCRMARGNRRGLRRGVERLPVEVLVASGRPWIAWRNLRTTATVATIFGLVMTRGDGWHCDASVFPPSASWGRSTQKSLRIGRFAPVLAERLCGDRHAAVGADGLHIQHKARVGVADAIRRLNKFNIGVVYHPGRLVEDVFPTGVSPIIMQFYTVRI